jgi:hypothetical protein
MNGPFVSLHGVRCKRTGLQVASRQEKCFALWLLQIIPNCFSIPAKKLVAGNLHVHRSFVKQRSVEGVYINRPDSVKQMPGTFMTIHE